MLVSPIVVVVEASACPLLMNDRHSLPLRSIPMYRSVPTAASKTLAGGRACSRDPAQTRQFCIMTLNDGISSISLGTKC